MQTNKNITTNTECESSLQPLLDKYQREIADRGYDSILLARNAMTGARKGTTAPKGVGIRYVACGGAEAFAGGEAGHAGCVDPLLPVARYPFDLAVGRREAPVACASNYGKRAGSVSSVKVVRKSSLGRMPAVQRTKAFTAKVKPVTGWTRLRRTARMLSPVEALGGSGVLTAFTTWLVRKKAKPSVAGIGRRTRLAVPWSVTPEPEMVRVLGDGAS